MTQMPSYPPLMYSTLPVADPRAPARRAGWSMVALGILSMLAGGVITLAMGVATEAMWNDAMARQGGGASLPEGFTFSRFRQGMIGLGVIFLAVGLIWLVLGVVVRGNGRAAILVALIFNVLMAGAMALWVVATAVVGAVAAMQILVMLAIPGVLIGLTLMWLMQARASQSAFAAMQPAMMQQQWMTPPGGMGGGYGYSVPPPPPPPNP